MVRRVTVLWVLMLGVVVSCSDDNGDTTADLGVDQAVADGALSDKGPSGEAGADATRPDGAAKDGVVVGDRSLVKPDVFVNPLPSLGKVTLFVNLGDSIAAGQGVSSSLTYAGLLYRNNDTKYASYKGKDLSNKFAGLGVADRAIGGSTSANLASQLLRVPTNQTGDNLVVISIGGNDIMYNFMSLVDPKQMTALAKTVTDGVDKVIKHFADPTKYGGKTTIALMNVYDFTDSMGNIPQNAPANATCGLLKLIPAYVGAGVVKNLAVYNQTIANYVKSKKILLVDIHAGFGGHGFHYANTSSPYYNSKDPTLWFQSDCIHPNTRGHHEIRKLVWKALFGN